MKPLQLILTALLLVSAALSHGQQSNSSEEAFYGYDSQWQTTSVKKATYFTRHKKISDTCWQLDTYNAHGPMIKSEQFIDEKGSLKNGRVTIFNERGKVDSLCYYSKGLPNGHWFIYTDPMYDLRLTYNMGALVDTQKKVKAKDYKQKDSLAKDEKESEFDGGLAAWQRYLNKNLKYPRSAVKASVQGQVSIAFLIDTIGDVKECFVWNSFEFALDEEALRIIRKSPRWLPATKEDKPVTSYKIQPIVFRLPW